MQPQAEDLAKMEQLALWLDQRSDKIPNVQRLIYKLRHNRQLGHLVNAQFVKRFYENATYPITDVEASNGIYDVDIQLDNRINIQTWHGQSTAGHIMESQFDSEGKSRNTRLGNISPLGGVKTDFDADCQTMRKKLKQLPDDKFGVVLLLDRFVGMTIFPEWWEEISDNKCLIKFSYASYDIGFKEVYGEAIVYHSENFPNMEEAKKIITVLGFNFMAENMPC